MTGEADSKPGRRAPTIDLKATEIENPAAGQGDAAPEPAVDPPPQRESPEAAGGRAWMRMPPFAPRAAIGLAVAVVVLGATGTGLWLAGIGPFGATAPPTATVPAAAVPETAPPPVAAAEISARLDKIERAIQAQRQEPAIGKRQTAADAQAKVLGDSLTALNRRVDDLATATQHAAKQADAAADSADRNGVERGAVEALGARIAALESAVTRLADIAVPQASRPDDTAARLAIAAEALRAAVERGAPYRAELTAVQALGADRDATAALEPFAAEGVPSARALARELAAMTPALERALGTPPGDKTFIEWLESSARRLVRITPVEAPPGTAPSAVVARIAFDATHDDIAAALADIAALPDAAKPLTADWVGKAQARDAAIAASRRIAAGALAALGKPATP